MMKKTELIEADICTGKEKYIVHQCNCVSKGAKGLARTLFTKFPYSNVYKDRNNTKDDPGTIKIRGNGKDQRFIVNLFGQYYPGKPGKTYDTEADRFNYFRSGLEILLSVPNLESVAFPELIGCDLAGGKWEKYLSVIEDFASKTDAKVRIYRYHP